MLYVHISALKNQEPWGGIRQNPRKRPALTHLEHEFALHVVGAFHPHRGSHGLRVEASVIESLRIDHFVFLHARAEVKQSLVRRHGGRVIVQVKEAETQ